MCDINYDLNSWAEMECPSCGDKTKIDSRNFVKFDRKEPIGGFRGPAGIECPVCQKIMCMDCGDELDQKKLKKGHFFSKRIPLTEVFRLLKQKEEFDNRLYEIGL